jgi:hypothetical protein
MDDSLKKDARHSIIIVEEDNIRDEQVSFSADAYNFTICANMT